MGGESVRLATAIPFGFESCDSHSKSSKRAAIRLRCTSAAPPVTKQSSESPACLPNPARSALARWSLPTPLTVDAAAVQLKERYDDMHLKHILPLPLLLGRTGSGSPCRERLVVPSHWLPPPTRSPAAFLQRPSSKFPPRIPPTEPAALCLVATEPGVVESWTASKFGRGRRGGVRLDLRCKRIGSADVGSVQTALYTYRSGGGLTNGRKRRKPKSASLADALA